MSWRTVSDDTIFWKTFQDVVHKSSFRGAFYHHGRNAAKVAQYILDSLRIYGPFRDDVRLWCHLYLDHDTPRAKARGFFRRN